MLSRALGSGWGILLPAMIIATLAFVDLPMAIWKGIIVTGLLLTSVMIWHKHYGTLCCCHRVLR